MGLWSFGDSRGPGPLAATWIDVLILVHLRESGNFGYIYDMGEQNSSIFIRSFSRPKKEWVISSGETQYFTIFGNLLGVSPTLVENSRMELPFKQMYISCFHLQSPCLESHTNLVFTFSTNFKSFLYHLSAWTHIPAGTNVIAESGATKVRRLNDTAASGPQPCSPTLGVQHLNSSKCGAIVFSSLVKLIAFLYEY